MQFTIQSSGVFGNVGLTFLAILGCNLCLAQSILDFDFSTDCARINSYLIGNYQSASFNEPDWKALDPSFRLNGLEYDQLAGTSAGPAVFFTESETFETTTLAPGIFSFDTRKRNTSKREFIYNDSVFAYRYTDADLKDSEYEIDRFGRGYDEHFDFTLGYTNRGDMFIRYDRVDFGQNPLFVEGSGLFYVDSIYDSSGMLQLDSTTLNLSLRFVDFLPYYFLTVSETSANRFQPVLTDDNNLVTGLIYERDTAVCFIYRPSDLISSTNSISATNSTCTVSNMGEALLTQREGDLLVRIEENGHVEEVSAHGPQVTLTPGWYLFEHEKDRTVCRHSFRVVD